jgi:sugar lactone lactonase YvrE
MGSLINSSSKGYAYNATTSGFAMWPPPPSSGTVTVGLPTCTQLGAAPVATVVKDYDCLVYVTFNPSAPGARQSQLTVTTANGSIYNFPLYGVGTGGQLAVDGGQSIAVAATGLGTTAGIALSPGVITGVGGSSVSAGYLYIADPTNNRVVSCKLPLLSNNACTAQGTIGTGLSGPMGVATDTAGNVYISDTGNNRVLKVNPVDGTQTVLGNYVWVSGSTCDTPGKTAADCPVSGGSGVTATNPLAQEPGASVTSTTAPPQYAFKAPQGLAVDVWNNVYVADTGNSVVVEIPSNPALGGAVPLQAYSGAPQFKNPVAVAVDSVGNIYVADTKNASGQIVKLPPGGGDLITIPGTTFTSEIGVVSSPNGVAVDAAGNVYVSSAGSNAVYEVPNSSGPGSAQFPLNFVGVSAPAGLALDSNGNLYVADSGNKQVLFTNRQTPSINFGFVPQDLAAPAQPVCSGTIIADGFNVGNNSACVLTVTNIGNTPVTFGPSVLSGQSTPFTVTNSTCDPVGTSGPTPLLPGLTCTVTATFNPSANTSATDTVNVNVAAGNGIPPVLNLTANGAPPEVKIILTPSYTGGSVPGTASNGATATITATVTQPNNPPGGTPTGTVTFTYVIDKANKNVNNCGTPGTSAPIPLNGAGVATFTLPFPLVTGGAYDITANYNGDANDSATQSADLSIPVPGIPVTATVSSTAAQLTFIYGSPAPVPVGTVTPTPPSPITYSFGSAASATATIGTYPVIVSFSGAGSCAYGFPPSVFATGGAAVVQENPATLTYTIPNFSAQFGAPNISFGVSATVTGAQNGDGFGATFAIATSATPPVISTTSSTEPVGTYTVTPTVLGVNVIDYVFPSGKSVATTPAPSSSLTVTKAGTAISASLSPTTVANTAAGVGTVTLSISVATTVPEGIGTPGGTVTLTDVFTPITATGLGTAAAPVTTVLPLSLGAVTYPPTGTLLSTAQGLHQYSFSYSGDGNFLPSTLALASTAAACAPSALAANCLLVDYPDFTLTSNTGPVVVVPGVIPSGNGLLPAPGQTTAAPETAVLFVNQILGFTGTVALTCSPQSPTYVSCFMTPTSVCFAASSSPACTNTSKSAAAVVAIETPATLPLGFKTSELRTSATRTVLAFLPLGLLAFCVRRRRRLSKVLWMLMVVSAIGAGMTGCGGNQVDFYTPIPTGAQTVTVYATWGGSSTQPAGVRSFVVPIAID